MPRVAGFKIPRMDLRPEKKLAAKQVFKSHIHDWVEVTNNEKFLKRMRNVVGAIKRGHDPEADIMKLTTHKVKNFIRKECKIWYCRRCELIEFSDDEPPEEMQ